MLMPGEGERVEAAGAVSIIRAGAETTGGAFSMSEVTLAPGFAGPRPRVDGAAASPAPGPAGRTASTRSSGPRTIVVLEEGGGG